MNARIEPSAAYQELTNFAQEHQGDPNKDVQYKVRDVDNKGDNKEDLITRIGRRKWLGTEISAKKTVKFSILEDRLLRFARTVFPKDPSRTALLEEWLRDRLGEIRSEVENAGKHGFEKSSLSHGYGTQKLSKRKQINTQFFLDMAKASQEIREKNFEMVAPLMEKLPSSVDSALTALSRGVNGNNHEHTIEINIQVAGDKKGENSTKSISYQTSSREENGKTKIFFESGGAEGVNFEVVMGRDGKIELLSYEKGQDYRVPKTPRQIFMEKQGLGLDAKQQKLDAQQQTLAEQRQKLDAQPQELDAQQRKLDAQQEKLNTQREELDKKQELDKNSEQQHEHLEDTLADQLAGLLTQFAVKSFDGGWKMSASGELDSDWNPNLTSVAIHPASVLLNPGKVLNELVEKRRERMTVQFIEDDGGSSIAEDHSGPKKDFFSKLGDALLGPGALNSPIQMSRDDYRGPILWAKPDATDVAGVQQYNDRVTALRNLGELMMHSLGKPNNALGDHCGQAFFHYLIALQQCRAMDGSKSWNKDGARSPDEIIQVLLTADAGLDDDNDRWAILLAKGAIGVDSLDDKILEHIMYMTNAYSPVDFDGDFDQAKQKVISNQDAFREELKDAIKNKYEARVNAAYQVAVGMKKVQGGAKWDQVMYENQNQKQSGADFFMQINDHAIRLAGLDFEDKSTGSAKQSITNFLRENKLSAKWLHHEIDPNGPRGAILHELLKSDPKIDNATAEAFIEGLVIAAAFQHVFQDTRYALEQARSAGKVPDLECKTIQEEKIACDAALVDAMNDEAITSYGALYRSLQQPDSSFQKKFHESFNQYKFTSDTQLAQRAAKLFLENLAAQLEDSLETEVPIQESFNIAFGDAKETLTKLKPVQRSDLGRRLLEKIVDRGFDTDGLYVDLSKPLDNSEIGSVILDLLQESFDLQAGEAREVANDFKAELMQKIKSVKYSSLRVKSSVNDISNFQARMQGKAFDRQKVLSSLKYDTGKFNERGVIYTDSLPEPPDDQPPSEHYIKSRWLAEYIRNQPEDKVKDLIYAITNQRGTPWALQVAYPSNSKPVLDTHTCFNTIDIPKGIYVRKHDNGDDEAKLVQVQWNELDDGGKEAAQQAFFDSLEVLAVNAKKASYGFK